MLRILLKVAISLFFIVFLFRNRDIAALTNQMLAINHEALVAAAACYWCVGIPSAIRWSLVVRALGHRLDFRHAFPIVLIGYFFNLTLVSAIGGDGVRMWEAYRAGLPTAVAITSVIIERFLQFLAHLFLIAAGIAILFYANVASEMVRQLAVLLLGGGVIAAGLLLALDRLPATWQRFRYFGPLIRFSADFRGILLRPRYAVPTILLGFINQIGVLFVVFLLAKGLNLPISFIDCLMVIPVAMLATAIPISIAGWGVREGAFVAGFGLIDLPSSDALALSLLFGALNTAVRLPGGLVWLTLSFRRKS
jgi:hypothetical protein